MTSVEDDLSGRRTQWKTTLVERDLSGMTLLAWNQQCIFMSTLEESETILNRWKTTSILAQPRQSSQLEPELGTAQPQLVSYLV